MRLTRRINMRIQSVFDKCKVYKIWQKFLTERDQKVKKIEDSNCNTIWFVKGFTRGWRAYLFLWLNQCSVSVFCRLCYFFFPLNIRDITIPGDSERCKVNWSLFSYDTTLAHWYFKEVLFQLFWIILNDVKLVMNEGIPRTRALNISGCHLKFLFLMD